MASTVAFWISSSFIRLSSTVSCFLTFSWTMRNVLLMLRRVELSAVPAKRFVRAAARDALQHCFVAVIVIVAFLSAPRAPLGVSATERLVAWLLAVIALLWTWPMLKNRSGARFSCHVKETFHQEAPCIASLRDIYYHGSVRPRRVFLAEPRHLRHRCLVLAAKGFCCSGPNLSVGVQDCQAVDAIDLDRMKFIPQYSYPCCYL